MGHEIAKFRLKLKKVGKTTRPFRYDLNQIPYDYTVEVTSRLKGLHLTESLMNYGQSRLKKDTQREAETRSRDRQPDFPGPAPERSDCPWVP